MRYAYLWAPRVISLFVIRPYAEADWLEDRGSISYVRAEISLPKYSYITLLSNG
jgi:hypothetical protein